MHNSIFNSRFHFTYPDTDTQLYFKGGDRQKSIFMDFSEHPFILLEIFFYFQIFKNESKILKLKGAAIYLKNSYFERF